MNSYQLQQIRTAAIIASQHKNAFTSLHHHHHFSNEHSNQHTQVQNLHQPSHASSSSSTSSNSHSRPIVERGASWSYEETRILLSLWGRDMVQRQLNNTKRTKDVWVKIANAIRRRGFERTPEQVRTRVFNMIAEYRRILKNPSPERKKKCIFFDALHKIYQAKDNNGVKAALNNTEEDYNLDPIDFSMSDENHDHNVTDAEDGSGNETEEKEIFAYDMSPSTTLANGHNGNCTNGNSNFDGTNDVDSIGENDTNGEINGTGVNGGGSSSGGGGGAGPSSGANMRTGESNNNSCYREVNTNRNEHSTSSMYNNIHGIPCKRLRTNSSLSNSLLNMSQQQQSFVSHHQSSQSYSNILPTIDTTASVLLVDRMFAHLAKETDVMRDWVQLEKERSKEDIIRRKESAEREEKREAAFLSTLTRMQEQFFTYLSNTFNTNNSGNNKFESIENGLSASSSSAMSSGNDCSFNCHSRSKKNTNHTTSMSSTNDTGKNNNVNENDLLSNCANKFNTNGKEQVLPEMDDENFSSTSPSVVSNNVSEGEDEDTQIRSTDDLCKPDICT